MKKLYKQIRENTPNTVEWEMVLELFLEKLKAYKIEPKELEEFLNIKK